MGTFGDRRFLVVVLLAAFVAVTLPFLFAARAAGEGYLFGGFLLNPLDGNTYLAKMYQGWRGDWLFTLPFTAETGQGAFLYPFYLLLGRLARLLHMPLIWCFHLARVLSGAALWLGIAGYLKVVLGTGPLWRFALIAAIFGSGLGWLGLLFGAFTPDFWVAEGYPFLSAYTNPHFSLSLVILLWLFLPLQGGGDVPKRGWIAGAYGLLLAFLSPFAVLICAVVYTIKAVLDFIFHNHMESVKGFRRLACILAGAAGPMAYQFWVTRTDPLMAGWNAQNLTPSPPFWETLLALGILLLPALPGIWIAFRQRSQPGMVAAIWMVCALVLLYLPWGLQRRFFVGLFIPLVVLGMITLRAWKPGSRQLKLALVVLLFGILPTNIISVSAQVLGARTAEPRFFYRVSEAQAYQWIESNLPEEAVILASPENGLFIPAHTGRKVVYGHPFETVNAQAKLSAVTDYFEGNLAFNESEFFKPVDFLFLGPRERALGNLIPPPDWPIVYRNEEVVIFQAAH